MKNWNSVEEKWREQLQNKSEDIPGGLWSRLEERLEEKTERRFPIYWAAAAMLLLALGLSWNWNAPAEKKAAEVTRVFKKIDTPFIKVALPVAPEEADAIKSTASKAEVRSNLHSNDQPVIKQELASEPERKTEEDVVAVEPRIEKQAESAEIVTVRLDIDPVGAEDVKPAFTQQKRRKSLFGKIVGEIRQALDGEPVNWQKLKEGNAAFENRIHTVANTYVKTEENLKRTLQLQ